MRILLLRILISWWIIPIFWIFHLPLAYLVFGNFKDCIKDEVGLSRILWYGDFDELMGV
jgi:hypothetical protein